MSIVTASGIQHVHSPRCLWENGRRKLTLVAYLICLQCCISRLWEAFGMLNQINAAQLNGLGRRMVSHPSNFALFLLSNILQRSHSLARRGPKWRRTPAELDSYDHSWASQQEPLELLPFPEVGSLQALEAVNSCLPTCVFFFLTKRGTEAIIRRIRTAPQLPSNNHINWTLCVLWSWYICPQLHGPMGCLRKGNWSISIARKHLLCHTGKQPQKWALLSGMHPHAHRYICI